MPKDARNDNRKSDDNGKNRRNIRQKRIAFGGGAIASITPKSVQQQKCVSAHLDFDAVLRLKAAVDEAAATLNRHDRATREGKRAGLWLAFYPEPHMMRFTLGRTRLEAPPQKPGKPRAAKPRADTGQVEPLSARVCLWLTSRTRLRRR